MSEEIYDSIAHARTADEVVAQIGVLSFSASAPSHPVVASA